ncbi:uracil-DNA glycosylase [Nakamurella leprariae]|uniref:uracil-DNA glycosylase n=1 Tax=Nakamurella leprariae TaxID=2803911 RepID=UPI002E2A7E19|nr:uracil-DNA glycosylase [Nakamurella leprariae]
MTATDPALAATAVDLPTLDALVADCAACPRLVTWRTSVGAVKRAAFADQEYWSRPVPGFGDPAARILLVGLAPAAHGGNRTGRMFTGDRSGDVLFAALHRAGLASQPTSVHAADGLTMTDARVTAPVHCAPPDNRPTPAERRTCAPWLARELQLLAGTVRVAVVLGAFGWQALLSTLTEQGWSVPRPRPAFGHGARVPLRHPDGRSLVVLGSYHVSQQNTFTGRLTPAMLDDVLGQARREAGLSG